VSSVLGGGSFTITERMVFLSGGTTQAVVAPADPTRIFIGFYISAGVGGTLLSLGPASTTNNGSQCTAAIPLEYRFSQEGALCQQQFVVTSLGAGSNLLVREVFYRPTGSSESGDDSAEQVDLTGVQQVY
jgi:hypothetical protein